MYNFGNNLSKTNKSNFDLNIVFNKQNFEDYMKVYQRNEQNPYILEDKNSFTKDIFSDTDMGDVLNSAISGNINNKKIFFSIWNLFGKDFTNCITTIASIIVIIVIHSIIKSISDGLENKSISRSHVLCSVHINCNHNNKKFYRSFSNSKTIYGRFSWFYEFASSNFNNFNDNNGKYCI